MDKYQQFKQKIGELRVFENEDLSKHTYFKIGGPAKLFFEAKNIEDLKSALEAANELKIPTVVIGAGANMLVSDAGFSGLVIKNKASEIKLAGFKGSIDKTGRSIKSAFISATSGTLMNQLARFSIDQGFEGLEFLLSVPGTVGGGLKINAHYQVEQNQFIGNQLVSAILFDLKTGELKNIEASYFEFSYDHSKIQETGEIVVEAIFKVQTTKSKEELWQKAMEGVRLRNEEQPVGIACSGCIFRNINHEDALRLATPNLTTSTGYIIDKLGLKGTKIGDAQVSEKHANYILNNGKATASEVLELINFIKEKAKSTYDLELKEEIFYIGDFK
ncbi:UDP-N-acetylmuramate dehydrogenase [Candidatus Curtissbacteria bacterium]|nr:UDP-N-acetylmuramate dehydrogenase [Candidatus Curtissbacteria bacterium]